MDSLFTTPQRALLHTSLRAFSGAVLALTLSCGVKGPPLPPLPDTPQRSDRADSVRDSEEPRADVVEGALRGVPEPPQPSPSPSPSKRGRGGR